MKTFRQLSIIDKVYYCTRHQVDYKVGNIREISPRSLKLDFKGGGSYDLEIDGELLDSNRLLSRHGSHSGYDVIVFVLESDAIRYCKTNLLKELRLKIEKAKNSIQEVVQFRLENIDHLNKDWIESEILKLEKMEREIL